MLSPKVLPKLQSNLFSLATSLFNFEDADFILEEEGRWIPDDLHQVDELTTLKET